MGYDNSWDVTLKDIDHSLEHLKDTVMLYVEQQKNRMLRDAERRIYMNMKQKRDQEKGLSEKEVYKNIKMKKDRRNEAKKNSQGDM